MPNRQVYYSPLFRDFRSIESNDYQRIIRFYEEKEKQIGQLDFGEYFELTVRYVDALFETGAYQKHLLLVDGVIEATIEYNVQEVEQVDIFRHMLFRKAASCYRLGAFKDAEHVLRELLRMRPDDQITFETLRKTYRQKAHALHQLSRASTIFFVMCAAMVTGFDVLFVTPFYEVYAADVRFVRNALIVAALCSFIGIQLYIQVQAHFRARRFQRSLLQRS